ncbi:MAG: SDR family oxidoreductase [Syntrophales bacterium]|nr:SDR family oxidoreductase [Syntrophales bacterium]
MAKEKKVAIITGSSRGVGAATARLLASRGYAVVINYSKSESEARQVEEECRSLGADTLLIQADVAEDEDCRKLVDETVARWGRLDALVNNAGTTKFCGHSNLEGLTKEDFFNIYGTNVVGAYQMVKWAAPHLKKTGAGAIVNVASIAGVLGIGSSIAYCASKAALINLTVTLARVLGPEIRVNAVCPGFIQGEWLRGGLGPELYEAYKTHLENTLPLRRTATPELVAETIRFFIEDAVLVTGEALLLDAGHHLVGTGPVMK